MILIDTDHATYLKYPESERGRRFIERLEALPESEAVGVAIVTVHGAGRRARPAAGHAAGPGAELRRPGAESGRRLSHDGLRPRRPANAISLSRVPLRNRR
jgi:hypothetical protein